MKNELIVISKPKSTISEDIRTLKTNLDFSLKLKNEKIIMVTSANPSEGKSFVSSNLAVCFAQNKKKVLLMDCDLRLGRMHKIFGLSNQVGLSDLISNYDRSTKYSSYIHKTNVNGLFVIARGTVPPNPSELLNSENFLKILSDVKKVFDYVIIDSTPINGLSDALVLVKHVDKIAIVCKYNKTNINDLIDVKKTLSNADAKIAGVIINSAPKSKNKYGYYTD